MDGSPSTTSSSQQGGAQPKRVKGLYEDVWLKTFDDPDMDRNRLDSRRRAVLNPDLLKPLLPRCYCGNDVHLHHDWYVMVTDGTLVCNDCAQCHCCAREVKPISRRLVCIDGLVLCYQCVKFFGHLRPPKLKLRVVSLNMKYLLKKARKPAPGRAALETSAVSTASTGDMGGSSLSPFNHSNSEYYDYNVPRKDRNVYTPKADLRRKIRSRYYDTPMKALPMDDNPLIVPPEYLAENTNQQPMTCPACNSIALGPVSYVVPSMARVYHKRCFRCCSCKLSLAHGVKLAGIAFEFCSCNLPLVWCTKPACRGARFLHHKMVKCHLGCLRPGGRAQMDFTVEISAEKSRRKRRTGSNRKKEQQQQYLQQQQPATIEDSVLAGEDGNVGLIATARQG